MAVDMRTVTIPVIPNDLAVGLPFHTCSCPAAIAINRVIRPDCYASVSYHWIEIHARRLEDRFDVKTPPDVRDSLLRIDQGRKVEAFSFTLDLPRSVCRD